MSSLPNERFAQPAGQLASAREVVRTWTPRPAGLAGWLGSWVLSWLIVGLTLGWLQREAVGPGVVGAIASMLSGALVLSLAGLPMALFGGRGRDVVAGAAVGCLAGMVMGPASGPLPVASMPLGLVMGAIVGATGWPLVNGVSRVAGVARSVWSYWRNAPPGPRRVS